VARCRKQKNKQWQSNILQARAKFALPKAVQPCRAAVNNAPRFWLSLRKGEKGKGGLKINGVGEGELPGGGISSKTE
jgi:hypothetical protein